MTTPVSFPRCCHLIIMYPAILCLTITAAHRSDHDNPRFKLTPYRYGSPSPPFTIPKLRVSDLPPPSPITHINPRPDVPPLAPESPPPQSPSSPPPPSSTYETPPPALDIPSPLTLSGSLRRARITPPSPKPNRNYINPRPPAYILKSPPPPSLSPPPPPTPQVDGFYRPPSHWSPTKSPPSPYPIQRKSCP